MPATACPSAHDLRRLILGELPIPETDRLAQHLEHCEACVVPARGLTVEDTLVEMMRRSQPGIGGADAERVAALVAQLGCLRLPASASVPTPAEGLSASAAAVPGPAE